MKFWQYKSSTEREQRFLLFIPILSEKPSHKTSLLGYVTIGHLIRCSNFIKIASLAILVLQDTYHFSSLTHSDSAKYHFELDVPQCLTHVSQVLVLNQNE